MKLIKFRIKDIDEKAIEYDSFSPRFTDKGMQLGKPQKSKRWEYVITDTGGKTYRVYGGSKPINLQLITEARCFVQGENDKLSIVYHSLYPGYFLTPAQFKKAIADYIGRAKRNVEFYQTELTRLQAL